MKFAKYSFLVNVINEDCKIIDPVNKSDPLHQTYELTERSKYGLQVLNLWYPESKAVVIIIHPQNTGPRARRLESIERSKSTPIDLIVQKKGIATVIKLYQISRSQSQLDFYDLKLHEKRAEVEHTIISV